MPSTKIQRISRGNERLYLQDGVSIGLSRYTSGREPVEMVLYQNCAPRWRTRQPKNIRWYLKRVPYLGLLIAGSFVISDCETGEAVGESHNKWWQAVSRFTIQGDAFQLAIHRREKYSLLKNGKQIALCERAEFSMSGKSAYLIYYEDTEPAQMIAWFGVFVDFFYLGPMKATNASPEVIKTIVLYDPHPERALWRPES